MSGVGDRARTSSAGAGAAGGGRQKPAVRRDLTVEAARGVILREGLGGPRLRDIAGRRASR